jgi:predicted RNA-binding Zn-ribbon protein involved in translation (DUF1610 family)
MQIRADQLLCPVCKFAHLEFFPILHHMVCAFVGPSYDFVENETGYACPKCKRDIVSDDETCEVAGTSARCANCFKEMVVSLAIEAHDETNRA